MTMEAKEGNWVGRATEKSITQLDGEADTHKSVAASPHFLRWEVYFFRFEQLAVQTFNDDNGVFSFFYLKLSFMISEKFMSTKNPSVN